MDLGCIDMGCIEKEKKESSCDRENSPRESVTSASRNGKNKGTRDSVQSSLSSLNKFTSQIRKPPHRKTSPLNWFPRKKVDSYLKRKIKMLQEVDGMNSTLDETLGDSNPHYSRVLREKMAVREAAEKAIEARKAAMVEASWCRILQAARIDTKEAEAQLVKAEKFAAEAFEAATAIGVIMFDIPDCAKKHYRIETTSAKGEGSVTHTVTASFETAFEVDKQVASAVKTALINLANCHSISKDECKELLRKISENPDTDENYQDLVEVSSECKSDEGSVLEPASREEDGSHDLSREKEDTGDIQKTYKKKHVSEKFNMSNLVQMMLERLRCLQEDELASLATIVATCGLNAALAEAENKKYGEAIAVAVMGIKPSIDIPSNDGSSNNTDRRRKRMTSEIEFPSLDKFLVKRLTRLEREVLESKNARSNKGTEGIQEKQDKTDHEKPVSADNGTSLSDHQSLRSKEKDENGCTAIPEFGSMLVKHSSKLEKEIEKAKTRNSELSETNGKRQVQARKATVGSVGEDNFPSLDKFLVKRMSRLEREVQEARSRNIVEATGGRVADSIGKENINLNKIKDGNIDCDSSADEKPLAGEELSLEDMKDGTKGAENSPDKIVIKPVKGDFGVQRQQRKLVGNDESCQSLDQILVKHVSRLEREKMELHTRDQMVMKSNRINASRETDKNEGSLDQILVKHKSRLEREKLAVLDQQGDQVTHSLSRRQARERELQEAWGGLSLGNSIRPHVSRLQRDKAAWLEAEEEERRRAMEEARN